MTSKCLMPAVFLVLFSSLLSSCSGGSATAPAGGSTPSTEPALPQPSVLARQAADSFGFISGEQVTAYLPQNNYVESDRTLRFSPGEGELADISSLAYASWYIPLTDSGSLVWKGQWQVPPAAGSLWLGLGNLEKDRWDWFSVDDPQAELSLPDSSPYQKSDGSLYLALVLTPGAGSAELDYFSLETRSDSGWLFHRLDRHELSDAESTAPYYAEPLLLGGNPAIYYYWSLDGIGTEMRAALLQSSSPDGSLAGDWSITELEANWEVTGSIPLAIGSELAFFTRTYIAEDESKLNYYHAASPAGSFSEELVITTDSSIGTFLPAVIGGLPALAYTTLLPEQTASVYQLRYASSSAVSGGSWSFSSPNPDAFVSGAISDMLSVPLDFNGQPMLIYRNVVNNIPQGIYVSYLDASSPLNPDWDHLLLGDGSDNEYFAFMRGGRPCFASYDYVVFAPDEVKFWTYHLTGENPGELADWTIELYDGLGLGGSGVGNIMTSGSELIFSHSRPTESPYLNGSTRPVNLWRSDNPANDPAAWQSEGVLSHRENSSRCQLIPVDGRLGLCYLQRVDLGFALDDRTAYELVWAVEAP